MMPCVALWPCVWWRREAGGEASDGRYRCVSTRAMVAEHHGATHAPDRIAVRRREERGATRTQQHSKHADSERVGVGFVAAGLDDTLADGFAHKLSHRDAAQELEQAAEDDGLAKRQSPGPDTGADTVGDVIGAVGPGQHEGGGNAKCEEEVER